MEMHQVRYFLALCEELNFHPPPPRSARGAALADARHQAAGGRARRCCCFPRARPNTACADSAAGAAALSRGGPPRSPAGEAARHEFIALKQTPLKLGLMCTIGPGNFVGLLSNLQAQHPGIELQINDAAAAELQERLLEGELEAAIYCLPDQIDERLHYLPLFREQFFIVLGRQHRLAMNNAVRVSDLNGERYLNRINCEQVNVARMFSPATAPRSSGSTAANATTGSSPWSPPASALLSCRAIPSQNAVTSWCGRWSNRNSGARSAW